MAANEFGNFMGGFQGAAYDLVYSPNDPFAVALVLGMGIVYHNSPFNETEAKNDPLDDTGRPDIIAGIRAARTFLPH